MGAIFGSSSRHGLIIFDKHCYLQSAVAEAASQVERQIRSDVGGATLALAKMVPKVTAAGNRLLDTRSPDGLDWLRSVSELGKVNELCASVYSCGPPP